MVYSILTVPQIPAARPVRMVVPVVMVSVTVLMSTMEATANTLILVGVVMVTKFKFLSHHVNPLSLQVWAVHRELLADL